VIPGRLKRIGQPFKDPGSVVVDQACLAVHEAVVALDDPPEDRADALMSKAHSQNRNFGAQFLNHLVGNPGVFGASWARGDHDPIGP